MKKFFPATAAVILCLTFSSCKDGGNISTAEEFVIDDIETGSETITISENETAASETTAEIISETVPDTRAIFDTDAAGDTEQAAITETVQTVQSEIMTEAVPAQKYETYGDKLGEIKSFNLSVSYPAGDGQIAEYSFCYVSLINSERIYRLDAGGSSMENTSAYLTDNQLKTILDRILGISVMPYDGASSDKGDYTVTAENSAGDTVNSRVIGEPPEEITKLMEELVKLADSDFDDKKFNEMHTNIQNAITNRAVDVYACLHSNIDRFGARGGDTAVYAGKGLTFKSRDEINAAADFLEEEPVMPIADNWNGYAFVKFGDDGSIEYINWSETEIGLSEEPLTYDDCMAYYIENGTVIAFSDYRKQNS